MPEPTPVAEEYRLARVHDSIDYVTDADYGRMDEAVCKMEDAARALRKALALYRSMVLSGEQESDVSREAYNKAMHGA